MNFIINFSHDDGEIISNLEKNVDTSINMDSIIEEKYKKSTTEKSSTEAFYQKKTDKNPTFFVESLVNDWIPWIEVQGERVIGKKPNNSYIIYSIKNQNELRYLVNHFDEAIVISDRNTEEEIQAMSDVILNLKNDQKKSRVLEGIISGFEKFQAQGDKN